MATRLLAPFLVLAATLGPWTGRPQPTAGQHPVALVPLDNCTSRNGVVTLPDRITVQHSTDTPIVLDDADADVIRFQQDRGDRTAPRTDPEAADGTYVDFVTEARWTFQVQQPGTYTRWTRLYLPAAGTWNHWEQIDDREQTECFMNTRDKDPLQQWYWYRSPHTYELDEGVHAYAVAFFHNGKRLDRIVFSADPEWTPADLGPPKSPRLQPAEGHAISEILRPSPGRQLGALTWQMAAGAPAQARFDYRVADGPWEPLTDPLPTPALGLQLRLTLTRAADGTAAAVRDVRVAYRDDPTAFHYLHSGNATLQVDRRGAICGAWLDDGTPLVAPLQTQRFVDVGLDAGDGTVRWLGDALRQQAVKPDDTSVAMQYADPDTGIVAATSITTLGDGRYQVLTTIDNPSPTDILEVRIAAVDGVRIGADSQDDRLAFPFVEPQLIANPAAASRKEVVHPRACMNWLDVSDTAGVCLDGLDDTLLITRLECVGARSQDRVRLALTRVHRIPAGGGRAVGSAILGLHAGDWHWAADRYREHFYRLYPRPRYPDWLRRSQGWYAPYLASVSRSHPERQPKPYLDYRDQSIQRAWYLGTEHLQLWGQAAMDHACPTYYLPDGERGGEPAFGALTKAFRDAGLYVGSYFNPNSLSPYYCQVAVIRGTPVADIPADLRPPDLAWFDRHRHYARTDEPPTPPMSAERLQAVAEHREVVPRLYPQMCWYSTEWKAFIRRWMEVYLDRYNHTMIYHDTLGTDPKHPEYNPHLGLKGDGGAGLRMQQFLAAMDAMGRARNPDFFQAMEAITDTLAIYATPLMSGRDVDKAVYRYTFPSHICYFGHANGWWNPPQMYQAMRIAFLEGLRYDVIRVDKDVAEFFWLREALGPWFYDATYGHDLGLDLAPDTVAGRVFTVANDQADGVVLTLANPLRDQATTVRLDPERYGTFAKAYVLTPGGTIEAVPVTDNAVALTVGKRAVAAVLFPRRATADYALLRYVRTDGGCLTAALANVGDAPLPVQAVLHGGMAPTGDPIPVPTLAPGAIETVTAEPTLTGTAMPVRLVLDWGGLSTPVRRCLGTIP